VTKNLHGPEIVENVDLRYEARARQPTGWYNTLASQHGHVPLQLGQGRSLVPAIPQKKKPLISSYRTINYSKRSSYIFSLISMAILVAVLSKTTLVFESCSGQECSSPVSAYFPYFEKIK
jgi:hypothetical protein